MYTPRKNSLKILANMQKTTPQKYFPVFARVRIQAPHVFADKLIPQEDFPACIGFVPGGNSPDNIFLYVMILVPIGQDFYQTYARTRVFLAPNTGK